VTYPDGTKCEEKVAQQIEKKLAPNYGKLKDYEKIREMAKNIKIEAGEELLCGQTSSAFQFREIGPNDFEPALIAAIYDMAEQPKVKNTEYGTDQ